MFKQKKINKFKKKKKKTTKKKKKKNNNNNNNNNNNLLTSSRTVSKQLLDQHTTQAKSGQKQVKNVSWTDDEVELLLGVVHSYSSQKDYEGLE